MRVQVPFNTKSLSARENFILFFWREEQEENPEVAWKQAKRLLKRIKIACARLVRLKPKETIDWDGYLKKIQALFPLVQRIEILEDEESEGQSKTGYHLPFENVLNDELLPTYGFKPGKEAAPRRATGWGYAYLVERHDDEAAYVKQRAVVERELYKLLRPFLPKNMKRKDADSVLNGVFHESKNGEPWDEWQDPWEVESALRVFCDRSRDTLKNSACEQMFFNEEGLWWGVDGEKLLGFDPGYECSYIAYHAACAAYMDYPNAAEKMLQLISHVIAAPGSVKKEDPETWVAYVKKPT